MTYLVLYKQEVTTGLQSPSSNYSPASWYRSELATWQEFTDKEEAIEFARKNQGVIVEAFEFDIKKDKA